MKFKWVIYISLFFVLAYLILQNPAGYKTAANKFTEWFSKSFSAFGRIGKQGGI